jgi:endonuclease/exonuclease/phosphatase family metal-dependent hydrolase
VDVVRFFQDGLDYYAYFGPTTVSGTFGTAILSRFPLENQRSVYTYSSDDEVATAVAEFSLGEKSVGIICVHPSGNEDVNRIFTETLIETASSFDNVIVMGDFNMREYTETLQAIGNALNDSWRVLNPIERVSLEELEKRSEEEEGDFVHGAPTLKRRIDYIFLSDSFEVLDSKYISNEASMTDHPAHWASIRLK